MIGLRPAVAPSSDDLKDLDRADLSPWFNPFLRYFSVEVERCGGEVRLVRNAQTLEALVVSDPVEGVASVFSRSRALTESWVRARGRYGVFSDFQFEPSTEVLDIFTGDLAAGPPPHRFRHSVRPISSEDVPSVRDLMQEVNGPSNTRWFDGLPTATEAGFLAEFDGRLAGAGWVSKVGAHARLHSLSVRAPYRRIGLGTDLLFARLIWARRAGASAALSEISQDNRASQAIAVRAGMRPVGQIYFHRPL